MAICIERMWVLVDLNDGGYVGMSPFCWFLVLLFIEVDVGIWGV